MAKTKLINPRGRAVDVDEKQVSDLLRQDWVYPPDDQKEMAYSHVHDKGDAGVDRTVIKKQEIKKPVIRRLADELPVNKI